MKPTIPLFVESERGHDTIDVPNNPADIKEAVENQLKDEKWVTVAKEDGSSELLTEKDILEDEEEDVDIDAIADEVKQEEKAIPDKWKNEFNVKNQPVKPSKAKGTYVPPAKPREEWEDKFQNVESACAVSKAKGG